MKQEIVLKHEFVEFMPSELKPGTIYVSIRFGTASHLCCCGCGNKVVTPLRPTDWKLIFDGKTVSLDPSIGNWSFACRSHYWKKRNRVLWARNGPRKRLTSEEPVMALAKERYFDSTKTSPFLDAIEGVGRPGEGKSKESFWRKLKKWLF
jgi:hypothetical protein